MSPRIFVMIGALVTGLLLPTSADAYAARVTAGALNLRTGPGVGYARMTAIPGGGYVEVIGRSGGWCHVEWAGYRGWVSCRYLASGGGYYYPAPEPRVFFDFFFGRRSYDRHYDRRPHYDRDRRHYDRDRRDRDRRYYRRSDKDPRNEERPLFMPRRR